MKGLGVTLGSDEVNPGSLIWQNSFRSPEALLHAQSNGVTVFMPIEAAVAFNVNLTFAGGFNYALAFLGGGVVLYCLLMTNISLVERIIKLAWLYGIRRE